MLALYFAPGASSMAAHIALHEVGTPFEARPLSFHRQENRTPDYLALNPEGKVPTLLIDGRPLTEVAAILFYLARQFPAAGLLSESAEAEAQVVSWMSFAASTLHSARRRGLEHANEVWSVADRKLGRTAVGRGTLFRRRHSSVPPLLAVQCRAEACAWCVPAFVRPSRSDAGPSRGRAHDPRGSRDRLRVAGLACDRRRSMCVISARHSRRSDRAAAT